MIAESGMILPGVTSRSWAISSRASHRPRTTPSARRPRTRCRPDVRRHASTLGVGVKLRRASNSSAAQPALPDSSSSRPNSSRSSVNTSTSSAA